MDKIDLRFLAELGELGPMCPLTNSLGSLYLSLLASYQHIY
jgi:hypothetical protein